MFNIYRLKVLKLHRHLFAQKAETLQILVVAKLKFWPTACKLDKQYF